MHQIKSLYLPLLLLSITACSAKEGAHTVNRLAQEQSPYLLQHADNPVDWYPWGEEAFAKAKTDDKPAENTYSPKTLPRSFFPHQLIKTLLPGAHPMD